MNKKNEYHTNDFALTASLLVLNFKVLRLDKKGSGKVIFVFNASDNLNQAVEDYWQDKLMVNPKAFFNAQKELKARIYAIA